MSKTPPKRNPLYGSGSAPRFSVEEQAAKSFSHPPPAIVEQVSDYEHIKAKIDNAIERQKDGRNALALAIREMLETKAYLTKYKTISAFASHEYGKSARWLTHQLEELTAGYTVDKAKSAKTPISTDKEDKVESETLTNLPPASHIEQSKPTELPEEKEENEKPAVHSADEKSQGKAEPEKPLHKQNGVPKRSLAIWSEMEETFGRMLRRADELNRSCINPAQHDLLISQVKVCMATLRQWRDAVK